MSCRVETRTLKNHLLICHIATITSKPTLIVPIPPGTKYTALFNSDFNVLTTVLWSRTAITIYIKFEATDRKKGFHRLQCTLKRVGRNRATSELLFISIDQAISSVLIAHWRHNILSVYSPCDSVSVYLMNVSRKNLSVSPLSCTPLKIPVCCSCVGGF